METSGINVLPFTQLLNQHLGCTVLVLSEVSYSVLAGKQLEIIPILATTMGKKCLVSLFPPSSIWIRGQQKGDKVFFFGMGDAL